MAALIVCGSSVATSSDALAHVSIVRKRMPNMASPLALVDLSVQIGKKLKLELNGRAHDSITPAWGGEDDAAPLEEQVQSAVQFLTHPKT